MNPIKKNKAIMISKRAFQVLVVAMIIVLAFPNKSGFKYEFALGGQWKHETLISPIDFPILKTEKEISVSERTYKANEYVITDDEIDEIYEQEKIELTFSDKLNVLSSG